MSDQPKDRPLRDVAESMRKSAYEHGGSDAVKAAEKHIDRALRELDRKRESTR